MSIERRESEFERARAGLPLVVLSPDRGDPREITVLEGLFAAGLARYHVRKPGISRSVLAHWLRALPPEWRPRLVLHQHHELVDELGLGGRHWRDDGAPQPSGALTSRSCHDLESLRGALGRYDSVFFGPLFPSLSKPGYGPSDAWIEAALAALLANRSANERSTAVVALGGVTADRLPGIRARGFDGAAVLGAVWLAADPVAAFRELQAVAHECIQSSTKSS